MKLRVAFLFVLMSLFVFTGAFAQTGDAVKTEIPFDFYVGTQKMTAGTYYISLDQFTHRVDISDTDKRDRVSVIGVSSETGQQVESPSLEFDHVGNDYFLRHVYTPELSLGFNVDKQEQQITGNIAGQTVTTRLSR